MQPTAIGKNVRDRIGAAVRQIEGQPIFRREQQTHRAVISIPILEGVVTSAITQAVVSGGITTYGKGNATVMIDSESGGVFTDQANSAYPAGVLVLNYLTNSGSIGIGTHITMYWYNGNLRLLTADC